MKIPSVDSCSKDQFLYTLRSEDERGFFSNKKGTNQHFLVTKRFLFCYELIKKYLSKDKASISVADFACGTGNVGLLLAEDGYAVDFVDNEEKFFDYIKLKNDKNLPLNFVKGDCSTFKGDKKYDAIFFGEAIEHMANPLKTLENLRDNLKTGGLLCLSTPNGDFVNCYEPSWTEVKDQPERNNKLANTIGNHVCEFTLRELADLVKVAGFSIYEQKLICSDQISRKSILRRIVPQGLLFKLDDKYSTQKNPQGKTWGRTQVIIAQRVH